MSRIATDLKSWAHFEADFLLFLVVHSVLSLFSFLVLEKVKARTVLKDDLAQLAPATDKHAKTVGITRVAQVTS